MSLFLNLALLRTVTSASMPPCLLLFYVFMLLWATEISRHHLFLIGLFCANPAFYWSVQGISATICPVCHQPLSSRRVKLILSIFKKRALPGDLKGTVAWDPLSFQKVQIGLRFSKPHQPLEFSPFPGQCWQLTLVAGLFYLICCVVL